MKHNNLIVTFTNIKSTRSFTLSSGIRQIIKLIIMIAVLLPVILSILLYVQFLKIEEYEGVSNKYYNLVLNNADLEEAIKRKTKVLNQTITQKSQELENIQDKITEIEFLIGINPKKDVESHQRLDIAKITAAERLVTLNTIPSGTVVPGAKITSHFGWRTSPISNRRQMHTGTDFRAKIGTPIIAPAHGIVRYTRKRSNKGYGKMIIIDHDLGFSTLYGHLSSVSVKNGDFVTKGQVIGRTGNTGDSTGPHLHYEIRYIGVTLDPINFIRWNLKNYEKFL